MKIKLKLGLDKESVNEVIGEWLSLEDDTYINSGHKHNWKCKCGYEFKNVFYKINQKIEYLGYYKCKKCTPNRNKFEDATKEWTKEDVEYLKWAIDEKKENLKNICIWLSKSETSVSRKITSMRKRGDVSPRYQDGMYHCIECGEFKDVDEFYTDNSRKNKLNPLGKEERCKECEKKRYPEKHAFKNEKTPNSKSDLFGNTKICNQCGIKKNIDNYSWSNKGKTVYEICNKCRYENDKKNIEDRTIKRLKKRGY